MNHRYVVIVDPYSTATSFPSRIKDGGFQCIAVHSSPLSSTSLSASFQPDDFAVSLVHADNLEETVAALKQYDIAAIMPGVETGVDLATELAEMLNLPRNQYAMRRSWRDKYQMQMAIARAGLRSIHSLETDDIEKALAWVRDQACWPVVVKPVESGGSDDVRRCENESDMRAAFEQTLGKKNFFGISNHTVLVQEFLTGVEYVVDAVSANGKHYTTNLVRYVKAVNDGAIVYDTLEYLPPIGEVAEQLIRYNDAVLDALGIVIGPSHSEIMLTDTGPVLIEAGARIHGGKWGPLVIHECSERSLIDLTVESYLNPSLFKDEMPPPNSFKKHCIALVFCNARSGVINSIPGLDVLKAMPSLFHISLFVEPGQKAIPTRDLYTSPAWLVLAHRDKEQLETDFLRAQHMNRHQQLLEVV